MPRKNSAVAASSPAGASTPLTEFAIEVSNSCGFQPNS
jgi:hypothetical protein